MNIPDYTINSTFKVCERQCFEQKKSEFRSQNSVYPMKNFFYLPFLFLCLVFPGCKSGEPLVSESADFIVTNDSIPDLAQPGLPPQPVYSSTGSLITDVDSLLNSMSLREKIGQLFVVPVTGTFKNEQDPDFQRLKSLVKHQQVGGLIFMRGTIYDQAVLTNRLQSISKLPLWITQDMEFGAAMRVQGTTRFTPAMGITATQKLSNSYFKGKITAREARALGVNQIFAPVLDVNNNPDNPVINVRSFSADPEIVAKFGQFFIDGVQSEGLLATAKHFPGHGDTDTDSHLALPVINHDYSRIDSLELVPFRVTINNGLASVMSAHIAFPEISLQPDIPGTLDKNILESVLIDSLGFRGMIVTDALDMKGITEKFSPGDAVVRALLAGADMMLMSTDPATAIYEIEQAVKTGAITEARIDSSVKKILSLKKSHGLFENSFVDIEALSYSINTPLYQAISGRIARESVTLLKNRDAILPVREIDFPSVTVIAVADESAESEGQTLIRQLRKYHSKSSLFLLDDRTGSVEITEMIDHAAQSDLIIIGSFIRVRSGQPVQLEQEQLAVLRQLMRLDKPSILIAFGNPYIVRDLPDANAQIMAWSASNEQISQTVPALFGASEISGRLPIRIDDEHELGSGLSIPRSALRPDQPEAAGMSSDSLLKLDLIMQQAIQDSVFPGGVVAAVRNGVLAWNRGYGYHDYTKTKPVSETDVYDLASLTKVLATTISVMKLYDEAKIGLDDKVSGYIEEFDTPEKKDITIRNLLLHNSGLPAFKVYVDKIQERDKLIQAIKNEPLEYEPGTKYLYSDLGFILLAEIVEIVSGSRIDRYARNHFYIPMGLAVTHFNPERAGSWMAGRIPPTEIDTVFGRGKVQARVHDERAYFMDGAAGHAGLFSSSGDIAKLAQMLLNNGIYAGRRYLSSEVVKEFTSRQSPFNVRGFGFDRKSGDESTAGTGTSMNTYGHLGFTGTSLWIDPEQKLAIILLTNRTYPYRSYGKNISDIRREVANAITNSITHP